MNWALAIGLVLGGVSDDARGAPGDQQPLHLRVGLEAGGGAGMWVLTSKSVVSGELAGFLELSAGRLLRPRVTLGARLNSSSWLELAPSPGFFLGAEARLQLLPRFAVGLGLEVSFSFQLLPDDDIRRTAPVRYDFFFVGPTLTLASVRLGEKLNHELTFTASMPTSLTRIDGVMIFLRYAVAFG